MNKVKKVFGLVLIAAIVSLGLPGCIVIRPPAAQVEGEVGDVGVIGEMKFDYSKFSQMNKEDKVGFVLSVLEMRDVKLQNFAYEMTHRLQRFTPKDGKRQFLNEALIGIKRKGNKLFLTAEKLDSKKRLQKFRANWDGTTAKSLLYRPYRKVTHSGLIRDHEDNNFTYRAFNHILGLRLLDTPKLTLNEWFNESMAKGRSIDIDVVEENGKSLLMFKVTVGYKYWQWFLDVDRDYMPIRAEILYKVDENYNSDSSVVEEAIQVDDFWVPKKVFRRTGTSAGDGQGEITYEISTFTRNTVTDEDFEISFPPGTEVVDTVENVSYRVLPSGAVEMLPLANTVEDKNRRDKLVVYRAQEIVDSVVDELDNVTDYSATVFNGVNIPIIRDMLGGRLQWKRNSGNWKCKMEEGKPYSAIHITDGLSWKCIDNKSNVDYYSNAVYGHYIRSTYGTDMFNMENILSNETWAKDPSTVTINSVLCYRVYTTKENENYEVWIDEATRTKVIRVTATDEIDQLLWQLEYGDYSDVEDTAWLPGKVVTKRYLEDMTVQFVSTYRFSNVDINSGLSDAIFAVDRVLPKGRPNKKTPFLTREMPDPNPRQLKEYLPYLTKGVTPLCDLLRAESIEESVEMLHQIGEYIARPPAYVRAGVPLFHDNGPHDVEQIMSNRRFLKILEELGSMPKSQASLIVNREINKTLPLYLSMLDEKVDRCRVAGKVRGGGQMSNNPDKSPVFGGLRFKILALIFTAGNLGLDETHPAVLNVARVAITQRKQWYYSREFRRIDRGKILSQFGLYNRQILVTGLFGTSNQQEKGMEDMLETVDIECQERKLTHFDSSATVHDFYARICGIPVDYSGGEQIVKFPEAIDDKSFDAILKAMEMGELLKIRYSKKE